MNTTIKAKNRILSLGLALCLLLTMVLVVPGPVEVSAAPSGGVGDANDGINFQDFVDNKSGFYYGTYDHATELEDGTWGEVKDTEKELTPILWRMFDEDNGNGKLTLWSEYVLDSHVFNQSTSDGNKWAGSFLQKWLHDEMPDSFSGSELALIPADVTVTSGTGGSYANATSNDQQFYLPWASGTGSSQLVRLEAEDTDNGLNTDNKVGYLKGTNQAVYYWLRSPYSASSYGALSVYTDGDVVTGGVLSALGVRPAFQLNPSSVIFTSKIVSSNGDGMGTIDADGYYSSIAAGGGDANYKLTVVGGNNGADVGTLNGVPASGISLETGGSIWLDLESDKTTNDGDYTINYKIVGTNGTTREIMGYGFTPSEADTALEIDASGLIDGTYTVYVWLQKNNDINSHEGTEPEHFTLTVASTGNTYSINHDASDPLNLGSAETGYDPADYTQTVTITTSPDPAVSDLRAYLGGDAPDKFTVSAVDANGEFTIAPVLGLSADTYEATVTVAGNYAKPQSFAVKFEVTGGPAIANLTIGHMEDDTVEVGQSYYKSIPVSYDGTAQSLTYTVTGQPSGLSAVSLGHSGAVSGTPDTGTDTGSPYTVNIKVEDGLGAEATSSYELTVTAASGTPQEELILAQPDNDTVNLGERYVKALSVTYTGSGTLTYDIAPLPAGVDYDSGTGVISGTPTEAGEFEVEIVVSDGDLPNATGGYTLKVVDNSSGPGPVDPENPGPAPTPDRSSSRDRSSGGSSTPDSRVAKTQLPASAFSWDSDRTLTIDHERITPLGLLSVQWDGTPLTRGTEFSVYEGSVIVRFDEDFIAGQSPGDHTVRVEFLNHTGETTVTVGQTAATEEPAGHPDNDTHNPNTGGYPDGSYPGTDNPNTGDGGGIWPALLLGSLSAAALVLYRGTQKTH